MAVPPLGAFPGPAVPGPQILRLPEGSRWASRRTIVEDFKQVSAVLGAGEGLQPLGLHALAALPLEKGFLHIGSDTDGTTVPADVGWGKIGGAKTADFIGKRSLTLPEHVKPDRLQLVGLTAAKGLIAAKPFIIGSRLRLNPSCTPTDGWITSAGLARHNNGRAHRTRHASRRPPAHQQRGHCL